MNSFVKFKNHSGQSELFPNSHLWKLSKPQENLLIEYCKAAKVIADIGSGDLELSKKCLYFGAQKIYALDYQFPEIDLSNYKIIKIKCDLSKGLPSNKRMSAKHAIISWPQGCKDEELYNFLNIKDKEYPDWLKILPRFRSVLYLGKNCDGINCGLPKFWGILSGWKCRVVIPNKCNNMVLYFNEKRPKEDPLNIEEFYGLAAGKLKYKRSTEVEFGRYNDEINEILSGWRKSVGID